ncbi:hypothetical protein CC80DRAFT_55194 [Byssothecium circinans]|uniref:DUF218 domain-containing protein n=1 Tax=Byssothecium circinans TaxID=147558 RepID=A0A6A5U7P0_9PLEO|nr:hypothetical protein CC80DRAFT_55194 [Byssothecium circinans]
MAAPTPSRKLPKSHFQRARTFQTSPYVKADERPAEPVASTVEESEHFTHPEHVIPPPSFKGIENLVIVCCHAIFHPDASSPSLPLHSPYNENNWYLAPFQKSNPDTGNPGEQETFMAHVLSGVDALSRAPKDDTLLILSGGSTKGSLTPLSEARSYYNAALACELVEGSQGEGRVQQLLANRRILLEEYATDSFQNLLLSILLFRRTTGKYPKQIRIITHAFKSKRFLDLHAPAIKWPPDRVQVQGIDPVMSRADLEETVRGEEKYGYALWLKDPFGVGDVLARKRQQRGWDGNLAIQLTQDVEESVKQLFDGKVADVLPWSEFGLEAKSVDSDMSAEDEISSDKISTESGP